MRVALDAIRAVGAIGNGVHEAWNAQNRDTILPMYCVLATL